MLHLLCTVLYFVSMEILTSATDQTVPKEDEMHMLRDGLQNNAETSPRTENHFRQILELMSYQSQRITTQAEETADLRREQATLTQAIKALSDKIHLQDQKMKAQNVEMVTQKKEIKAQADGMKAQAEEIKAQAEEIKAQAEMLKSETKKTKVLERKGMIQIQTIQSQAGEIKDLRDQHLLQELKIAEQTKKIEKCCVEHTKKTQWQQAGDDEKKVSKRIVLHSDVDIVHLVTTHSTEIQNLQNNMTKYSGKIQTLQSEVSTMKNGLATKASGSTYVRWGRKTCPSVNGTELVYSGFAGGSHYTDPGAASNYLCLSPNPLWGHYNDGHNARAQVYGTEYELYGPEGRNTAKFTRTNVNNEDAACSVCRSSRPTVLMIPGRNQCYPGWTLEYKGYLVAGAASHTAASEYVCLDDRPEVLQNGHADRDGKLFYFVEGRSGSLPCPPYIDGRELTCVVCTK